MKIKAKPITEQEYMLEIAEAKIQLAIDRWERWTRYPRLIEEAEG